MTYKKLIGGVVGIKFWFAEAVPRPNNKNFHTQLGVHCEEVNEMLIEFTPANLLVESLINNASKAMHELAEYLKANNDVVTIQPDHQKNFLDALCDQVVTAVGVGHMMLYDIVGAINHTNDSNWSKFDSHGKPIFNENFKIMKGPSYFKTDLTPFLGPFYTT